MKVVEARAAFVGVFEEFDLIFLVVFELAGGEGCLD